MATGESVHQPFAPGVLKECRKVPLGLEAELVAFSLEFTLGHLFHLPKRLLVVRSTQRLGQVVRIQLRAVLQARGRTTA